MGFLDAVSTVLNESSWQEKSAEMPSQLKRILENARTLEVAGELNVDRMINLTGADEDILRLIGKTDPSHIPGGFSTQEAIQKTANEALVAVLTGRY